MNQITQRTCTHIINDETKTYIAGVGFTGTCIKCGAPVVQSVRTTVKHRTKPKMSKKERRASRAADKAVRA